jgi:hypothetical protein
MSINLGIYDFFAYLVPGLMYLFLLNEFSSRIGLASFNITQLNLDFGVAGVIVLAAYVIGHLFDVFAQWFCYKLLTRKSIPATTLENIQTQYPHLNIRFEPKDYHLLFVLLRERNLPFTEVLDRFEANSILLKNVSFASILFAILQLSTLFGDFSIVNLLLFLSGVTVCWMAFNSSRMYHTWFFLDVFEASLAYGTDIQEVLANKKISQSKSLNVN